MTRLRFLACALSLLASLPALAAEPPGFKLVWSDEFDVDGPPDPAKWGYEHGFRRNAELQWYQADNAACRDGLLVIEARRETKSVAGEQLLPAFRWRKQANYTSASIKTSGKFNWQYGRMEVRAKVTASPGLWPAIWTLGERGRWPANGEVDLMEYYDGKILANAAWRPADEFIKWDASRTPIEELGAEWDTDFHTWRMDWTRDKLELSVDARVLNTIAITDDQARDGVHPFRQPHYILLNLAIGGTHGGDPSGTDFPSRYLIDYVRVYEPVEGSEASLAASAK